MNLFAARILALTDSSVELGANILRVFWQNRLMARS
jgi:hypothetical protein